MRSLLFSLVLLSSSLCHGANFSQTWTIGTTIPDNDAVGASDTQTVNVGLASIIQSVQVHLEISGGWNGDLYAYLSNGDDIAVLLNRVGRTSSNPVGFGSSGMNVTLSDDFTDDIHTELPDSGTPTGNYQPDGRSTDPLVVLDTDPRDAMLSVFNGLDANGEWTLFIADQSAGDVSTIESWGMTITTIPEPSSVLLMLLGSAALLRRHR